MTRHLVEFAVALLGGYAVGMFPVGWLLVRRRSGLDLRRSGRAAGGLDVLVAAGPRAAFLTLVFECLKGAVVGLAASQYSSDGWFIASAIAGCVLGDAFPATLAFRRGGRGLVPLVGGVLVGLPGAGTLIALVAIPVALFTSMRGRTYEAVVLVAVPLGLLLRTRDPAVLIPAAIIVVTLLAREVQRDMQRRTALTASPWRLGTVGRGVVIEQPALPRHGERERPL